MEKVAEPDVMDEDCKEELDSFDDEYDGEIEDIEEQENYDKDEESIEKVAESEMMDEDCNEDLDDYGDGSDQENDDIEESDKSDNSVDNEVYDEDKDNVKKVNDLSPDQNEYEDAEFEEDMEDEYDISDDEED